MSGRNREFSKKSVFLDRIFGRPWLVCSVLLGIVVVSYILCFISGNIHTTVNQWYMPLVIGAVSFLAILLVMGFQLINPWCTARFMDFGELFFAVGIGAFGLLWFLFAGFWNLFGEESYDVLMNVSMYAGVWAGLCVVHNLREEYPN